MTLQTKADRKNRKLTEEIFSDIIKAKKDGVPIFTGRVRYAIESEEKMSFVISQKQYLASAETKVQYEPFIFDDTGFEVRKIDVNFGHPLYATVADIFHIRSVSSDVNILPVVPDGCMSMVFRNDNEKITGYICGVIDELRKVEIKPQQEYIFIRFVPGAGYTLVNEPANLTANKTISIRNKTHWGEQVLSILERENDITERVRLISKLIRVQMQSEPNKYLIKYCTERIFQSQGNIKVEKLAEETGFTSRYIGKMFDRCVGLSPKLFAQIIRMQASMNCILEDKEKLLVEIAVDCGFFDHAHMNRTYRKFLGGCSSGEFRKSLLRNLDYDKIDDYISV